MTTLRHYIERLASRPATISFEEIRTIVESAPYPDTRRDQSFTRRRTLMISGILSLLALTTVALLLPHRSDDRNRPEIRSTTAGTAGIVAGASSSGRSTASAGIDRSNGKPVTISGKGAVSTSGDGRMSEAPRTTIDAIARTSSSARSSEDSATSRARALLGRSDSVSLRRERGSGRDSALHAADGSSTHLDVSGVRVIELPADVLARLGIVAEGDGIWVTMAENRLPMQIARHGTRVFTKPERLERTFPMGRFPAAIVTDDLGAYRAYDYDPAEVPEDLARRLEETPRNTHEWWLLQQEVDSAARSRFSREIGSLVPILVRSIEKEDSSASERGWRPDVIVWFRPVPGFLDLLPDDVRTGIEKELSEAKRRSEEADVSGDSRPSRQPRRVTGERPYLDIMRAADGAIVATTLQPNPTRDHATLTIELGAARTVDIAIVDIQGRPVRPVAAKRRMDAGKETVAIEVAGLKRGIYLVAVSTDRGEQAVQRIIVPE